MNDSNRSMSQLVYGGRTKIHFASPSFIPTYNESISSHLNSAGNEAIESDDDAFCTFALRRTTIRKLHDHRCDYFVRNSKQELCTQFERSSKLVKSSSSESIDRPIPNDTELGTTYDSPVKRSKKTMATNNKQNDITVNFEDLFSMKSPRTVVMNEIFSDNNNLDDQNIENIIFGTTTAFDTAQCTVQNNTVACSDEQHDNPQCSRVTKISGDDGNTVRTDAYFIPNDDGESENEGIVWQRILTDLKSVVHNYHRKGALKQHDTHDYSEESNNGLTKGGPLIVLSNPTTELNIISPSNTTILESPIYYNGDDLTDADSVSKNRRRFNTRLPSNTLSTRSNLSNDAVTISTYTGSSIYSIVSTDESTTDNLGQHDITVVDTRPSCCTIVRRLSIFLIQNEKRWTMDKDIASLFPNYLTCSTVVEQGRMSSRDNNPTTSSSVLRRKSQNQKVVGSKYTANSNCCWRLSLRFRRAKLRLKSVF